jgi:hypothetical protein
MQSGCTLSSYLDSHLRWKTSVRYIRSHLRSFLSKKLLPDTFRGFGPITESCGCRPSSFSSLTSFCLKRIASPSVLHSNKCPLYAVFQGFLVPIEEFAPPMKPADVFCAPSQAGGVQFSQQEPRSPTEAGDDSRRQSSMPPPRTRGWLLQPDSYAFGIRLGRFLAGFENGPRCAWLFQ